MGIAAASAMRLLRSALVRRGFTQPRRARRPSRPVDQLLPAARHSGAALRSRPPHPTFARVACTIATSRASALPNEQVFPMIGGAAPILYSSMSAGAHRSSPAEAVVFPSSCVLSGGAGVSRDPLSSVGGAGIESAPISLESIARLFASTVGIIAIVIGLWLALKLFGAVAEGLQSPDAYKETFQQWTALLGGDRLKIKVGDQELARGPTAALGAVSIGLMVLTWLTLGVMLTGAKIVSWTSTDREAVKRVLQHALGNSP